MENINLLVNNIAELSDETAKELVKHDGQDYKIIIKKLEKIVELINLNDFLQEDKLLSKLFNKNKEDKLYNKYNDVCLEVEKVAVELKVYENKLRKASKTLKNLLTKNLEYYKEISEAVEDNALGEKQTYDLRLSKTIVMQNVPLLENLVKTYDSLCGEINTSFMVTLPILNQCLNNIIILKRKKMTKEALSYVDKKTSEFLKQNNLEVSKETEKLVEVFGKDVLLLEDTMNTINGGIEKSSRILKELNK